MNTMKKTLIISVALICVLISQAAVNVLYAGDAESAERASPKEVRYDKDIFRKWMPFDEPEKSQHVYSDVMLSSAAPYSEMQYPRLVMEKFRGNALYMADDNGLLRAIYSWDFSKAGTSMLKIGPKTRRMLSKIYSMLDRDIPSLFRFLENNGLDSLELNGRENFSNPKDVRIKYTTMLEMLFAEGDYFREREYELAAANRLVEYCFGRETWPAFEKILYTANTWPVGRFAYSTIWYFLSGTGWKQWHMNAILGLKEAFKSGARIVYIAGGNDVYQLIKAGIYDIEIIDPLLPTQPRFYAGGWKFLFKKNGIGDEIILNFDGKTRPQSPHPHLVMRRAGYKEGEPFTALLHTGKRERLTASMTTWIIYDRDSGTRLGRLVINRRFCNQADFASGPGKALLMSFNELFFVATADVKKSWGINPEKFSTDFKMYVKQLRKPLTREVILNIRKGEESPLQFLSLGSEVN
jgi:hypothetical protein